MTSPSDLMTYAESDIDADTARQAFAWTSMEPEERGRQVIAGYMQAMIALEAEFERWVTDDNREAMRRDLEAYRQGYLQRLREWLAAHSKCASWVVTGRSNFPVARAEKANEREHKLSVAWHEWSDETLERLRRTYDPKRIARAPISSSDPDAPEKLRAKIENAKAYQETCKKINRIVRSKVKDEAKVLTIMAETGFSEETARKLLVPDDFGYIGIPAYELTNNLANIKRMEARIAEIERQRAEDEATVDDGQSFEFSRGWVYNDSQANRYQIKFRDRPNKDEIAAMKARGFHWTPSLGVWQRQRTPNAKYAVRELTGVEL